VFEDEQPQPDETSKEAGLINFINEEKKEDPPHRKNESTQDDEFGNASSNDKTTNQ
jgi:hypothetical protein